MMSSVIHRVAENVVKMKKKNGCTVTIKFRKEDNPDIENIVIENLLTSYERRIMNNIENSKSLDTIWQIKIIML